MWMVSTFKEFVTKYNRTYETKEGEDQPWLYLSQSDLPPSLALSCWVGKDTSSASFQGPLSPQVLAQPPRTGQPPQVLATSPI